MRAGWDVKELGEVTIVGAGNSAPQKKELFINGEFPFIRTSDVGKIRKGAINSSFDYLNAEGIKKLKLFKKGTILFPKSGASTFLNHRVIMDIDGYVSSHLATIKSKEILEDRFVWYYLILIDAKDLMQDIAYPSLKLSDIKQIPISFPPLKEQQRIVAILDKTFAAIEKAKANAEQNLKNANELFESYLQNVFSTKGEGWEEKTLEQISDVFGRGKSKHRPRNDKKLYGGKYPFIQTGDIRNCNHFVRSYSQTYNEVGLAQSKLWPKGTICITIAANIAETGVLDFDACFPDSVIGIVVNKKLADIDFVEYLLQSFKVNLQALSKGSAQDNINLGTFKDKMFPFPSVDEQKIIVHKLNVLLAETKKLAANYQQKLADLEELKKSVLQKAFKGELKTEKELIL
ncbi:restriction endonuclease subunit S [Lutibacter sp.]|uniref:restriction endonuclease subunit S n=1 Tax=Lutibacter sp. TaxID=1925666 RepID=UPI0035673C35